MQRAIRMIVATAAGVLLAMLAVAAQAPAVTPGSEVDLELKKYPAFEVLREADPEAFSEVVRLIRESVTRRPAKGTVSSRAWEYLGPRLHRYVMAGTDGAVVRYYQVMVRQLEGASKLSPSACDAMIGGQLNLADYPNHTSSAEEIATMHLALANLIKSARGRAMDSGMPPDVAKGYLDNIFNRLVKAPRDREILEAVTVPPSDYGRRCELNVALIRQVAALPIGVAADLFRFLASTQRG